MKSYLYRTLFEDQYKYFRYGIISAIFDDLFIKLNQKFDFASELDKHVIKAKLNFNYNPDFSILNLEKDLDEFLIKIFTNIVIFELTIEKEYESKVINNIEEFISSYIKSLNINKYFYKNEDHLEEHSKILSSINRDLGENVILNILKNK